VIARILPKQRNNYTVETEKYHETTDYLSAAGTTEEAHTDPTDRTHIT
jgi:hypothetical protein